MDYSAVKTRCERTKYYCKKSNQTKNLNKPSESQNEFPWKMEAETLNFCCKKKNKFCDVSRTATDSYTNLYCAIRRYMAEIKVLLHRLIARPECNIQSNVRLKLSELMIALWCSLCEVTKFWRKLVC